MVFIQPATLGLYKPKRYFRTSNVLSTNIIALKNGYLSAKLYFTTQLKYYLSRIEGEFILASVPTSSPDKESPINQIIERLCNTSKRFKNGSDLLKKTHKTQSLCKGGNRDFYEIKDSFSFNYIMPIRGKRIILLDDVVTTGVSINAARFILLENGAKEVIPFALGLTAKHTQFTTKEKAQTPAGAHA